MIYEIGNIVINSFSNVGVNEIMEALSHEFFSTSVYNFYRLGDMAVRILKFK